MTAVEEAKRFVRDAREAALGSKTVSTVIDEYELHLRKKGNRQTSIGNTVTRLKNLLELDDAVNQITTENLQQKYEERCDKVAPATHRNELAEVKTFLRYCVEKNLLRKSPAEGIKPVGRRARGKLQLTEEAGTSGTVVAKSLGHETHRVTEEHYLAPGTTEKVATQKTMDVLVGSEEPGRGNS